MKILSRSAKRRSCRISTNGSGGFSPPRKPRPRGMAVSRVTRIAASTIGRGLKDIEAPDSLAPGRVRRAGGGRKSLTETDPQLLDDLKALVEPDARGDPMSSLRWTCKSLRRLSAELNKLGHQISHTIVGEFRPTFRAKAQRGSQRQFDRYSRRRLVSGILRSQAYY